MNVAYKIGNIMIQYFHSIDKNEYNQTFDCSALITHSPVQPQSRAEIRPGNGGRL